MIISCDVWLGFMEASYRHEIEQWSDDDTTKISLAETDLDDPEFAQAISDDGMWLDEKRQILFDHADTWRADPIADIVRTLQDGASEWTVGFIYRSGTPTKAVENIADRIHERRVDMDTNGMAQWAIDWLAQKNISFKNRDVAYDLSLHCGDESLEILWDSVQSLGSYPEGTVLEWEDVAKTLGGPGSTPVYMLPTTIASGDASEALMTLERLGYMNPIPLVSSLVKRYRQYLMAMDMHRDMTYLGTIIGVSPGQARFIYSEAQTLGPTRAARCYTLLQEVENGLKGGSTMDPWDQMRILVIRLTQQFRIALKYA